MSIRVPAPAIGALPTSAWVMAWLFLIGQVAGLLTRGANDSGPAWIVVSMLLAALIVRWFADGVLRARTARLMIVWIVLCAATSLGFVGLAIAPDEMTSADLVTFVCSLAQLVALGAFCTTDYFKDRRLNPTVSPKTLAPLLLIAVLTGLVGAMTAPAVDSMTVLHFNVTL